MTNLRLVILECPYDTWNQTENAEFFQKMVGLKLAGYLKEYPYGMLPVNSTDFVCAHLIVCAEEKGELNPVLALRSISQERCKIHHLQFPMIEAAQECKSTEHEMAIRRALKEAENKNRKVAYASSVTARPDYRGNQDVRDAFKLIHIMYHRHYGFDDVMSLGALKFKMDKLFFWFGYELFKQNGKELGALKFPFAFDAEAGLFHLKKWSDEAIKFAEERRKMWENRITIAAPAHEKKAA